MNAETSYLYGFVTADPDRMQRFVDRWHEAGVTAIKRLAVQIIEYSIDGDDRVAVLQRRLLHEAMARVSWLALGYAVVDYYKERSVA